MPRDGPGVLGYKETIHYSNRSGVRATCPDCHVPKEWVPKILRKIEATGELYGKMMGTISTPAKFEANRTRLAQKEWGRMKANDSLACRNCHSTEGMSHKQSEKAKARHAKGVAEGAPASTATSALPTTSPKARAAGVVREQEVVTAINIRR